jgi:hypothetical protein
MKTISIIGCVAAIVVGMSAPASAADTDPEVIIYRFPGVMDDGGVFFVGISTVFNCTNFSGVTEKIRFATRTLDGTLVGNTPFGIPHLQTLTASTHPARAFANQNTLTPLVSITQGTTAIAATSTSIICTAAAVDAANAKPDGIALRGIRFNPIPGSQE